MLAQTSNRLPNMINMSNCYQCNVTPGMAAGNSFKQIEWSQSIGGHRLRLKSSNKRTSTDTTPTQ